MQERLLEYAENNGYPFAIVKLDSVQIIDNTISSQLFINKKQIVYIDSITIEGNAKIKKTYLYNYLGIKEENIYDESRIEKIDTRLKELPFLKEEKPLNIAFQDDKAVINLFLKNKKASQFTGVLGVLPNNKTTGRLLVTGEIRLSLHNPFGTGKLLQLNWSKLQPFTQDLKSNFVYPYVLSTPIGLDLRFDLYKKDSTYLDLVKEAGIQYLFIGGNYIKAFVKNKQSYLLNIDTNQVIQNKKLPDNIDISTTTYGLGYKLEKLDYRFNPRRGFCLSLKGGAGTKKIKKNEKIISLVDPMDTTFNFESLYDTLKLTTAEYEVEYDFNWYFLIKNRSVIKTGTQGAGIWSENIFQNDMYRIGGMHVLRGFDEESIFSSYYNVFTLEYRYLLGLNSYFSLFGDAAYYINEPKNLYEWAYGFGTGVSFETKAGIFSLNYALGAHINEAISFKSAKIHFGYVNYF